MTGRICLKSSPNTTTLPPNGLCAWLDELMISLRLLSSASKQNLCAIRASSQIISLLTFRSFANSLPRLTLQVEFCKVGTWIANFEWAVLPPSNNKDAMPFDATVKTISPFERNAEANVFHTKVFPILHIHKEKIGLHFVS